MQLIVITKKEKAAAHLMKESIFQIKDYISENLELNKTKNDTENFSLMIFMADISMSWMSSMLSIIDDSLRKGKSEINVEDAKKIIGLIDFYKNSSGEIFFAENLFEVAKELLIEIVKENDSAILIRNIE